MNFGAKTEVKRCSRCMRTKEEAINDQKAKGLICEDKNCTFKQAIYEEILGINPSISPSKKKPNGWAILFAVLFVIASILAIYFYNNPQLNNIFNPKPENKVIEKEITLTLTVNPTSLLLEVGKSESLSYTFTPSKETNQKVTWSSNNSIVATVNSSGMVTAVAPGDAVITASIDNGVSDACHVSIVPDKNDMLTIEASQRLFTDADLRGLSKGKLGQLEILRNGIYARHGYIFKGDDLRAYFSKKDWYKPLYNIDTYVFDNFFNDYEKKNVGSIKNYEK